MSTPSAKNIHNLEDYAGLLALLEGKAFDYAVIGGCAVGAYAHLRGQTVLSGDLDLYASDPTLMEMLLWMPQQGMIVRKRPQPRSIPTAFIEWEGLEVNVLTRTDGLPEPERVLRDARAFRLKSRDNLEVLIADPFDLLRNKLAVNRPKDRPHIAILRSFVEEEVVAAFQNEGSRRERIGPARRLLDVLKQRTLPPELAARIIPLAKQPVDFRFLIDTLPSRREAEELRARAPEDLREELAVILKGRRFR